MKGQIPTKPNVEKMRKPVSDGQTEPWGQRQDLVQHLNKHGGEEHQKEIVYMRRAPEVVPSGSGRRTARVKAQRAWASGELPEMCCVWLVCGV